MADLVETEQWEDGIYQLETTDPVEGGADGVDNVQAKQLANRTAYLKQQLENNTAQATEAVKGIAKIATQAEVVSGVDDVKIITALKLKTVIDTLVGAAPGTLDTLNKLATALGYDPDFAITMINELTTKAPLSSPAMTGTPTINDALAYAQSNILGSVSQTDGVPAGAIFESGSNANGEYTKFADGSAVTRLVTVVNETTAPGGFAKLNRVPAIAFVGDSIASTSMCFFEGPDATARPLFALREQAYPAVSQNNPDYFINIGKSISQQGPSLSIGTITSQSFVVTRVIHGRWY